jgi:hypothetical protein
VGGAEPRQAVAPEVGEDHLGDGRVVIDDEDSRHASQRRQRSSVRQPARAHVTDA